MKLLARIRVWVEESMLQVPVGDRDGLRLRVRVKRRLREWDSAVPVCSQAVPDFHDVELHVILSVM